MATGAQGRVLRTDQFRCVLAALEAQRAQAGGKGAAGGAGGAAAGGATEAGLMELLRRLLGSGSAEVRAEAVAVLQGWDSKPQGREREREGEGEGERDRERERQRERQTERERVQRVLRVQRETER